mgnify:CR=1 FL=1
MGEKMNKRHLSRLLVILLTIIVIIGIFISKVFFKEGIIIDDDIPQGMYCNAKDTGMVPNDASKAKENGNLFIQALNEYGGIVIDDIYYIGTPSENLISRNVEIIGTDNGELISALNSYTILFSPDSIDNLTIKNMKFKNINEDESLLIVYNPSRSNAKVNNVNIENCSFEGNISLYRQYGDITLDPDSTDYGINNFTFCNNKIFDTRLSFIVFSDIPVTYCKVSDNMIKNFDYTFIKTTISNDIPYEQELYNHIKYLEVENNFVICEDNWWGEASLGSYYAFVLYEGTEVLYDGNYVDGIKTLKDVALYDAYLSAEIVNYTNNIWKNNICFAEDKTNNTLLKSKGGGKKPLIRNYLNNKFIVEEAFAERLGQSKDNLKVDFISLTQYAKSYIIDNNIFDVYDIRFPVSSSMIGSYIFSNNTVKAKKGSGKLAIVRLKDEYSTDKIEILNNNIEIDERTVEPFTLVCVIDYREISSDIIDRVVINNNRITAPFGYLFYGVKANTLEFKNNEIVDVTNKKSGFKYNSDFINTEIFNNTINGENISSL